MIYKPELYHGFAKKPPFFEGWYYKQISADGINTLILIPGVFFGKSADDTHAFIQVYDGKSGTSWYCRFPADSFIASRNEFSIHVGGSRFSRESVHLDIHQDGVFLVGDLNLKNHHPWPVTPLSPGAMGPYGFLPFMECNHAVLSFTHSIEGSVSLNGADIDFSQGKGYMEKDWGSAFPSTYIWFQTNHFKATDTSLFGSIADIPWRNSSFSGFILGFMLKGKLYRYATYSGAKIRKLQVSEREIELIAGDRKTELEVNVERHHGAALYAPYSGEMRTKIYESLSAKTMVRFYSIAAGLRHLEWEGSGEHTGLECVGSLNFKF